VVEIDRLIDDRIGVIVMHDLDREPARRSRPTGEGELKMAIRGNLAVAIVAAALVMAIPGFAQESKLAPEIAAEGAPVGDLPLADYQAFDSFAATHPDIISELNHHPRLLENDDYLAKHAELRNFLASHSELRAAMIEDPGNFLASQSGRRIDNDASPEGSSPDK
jgi:hypothetical protein